MPFSKPAVEDALLTRLDALLTGVRVELGLPAETLVEKEAVHIVDSTDGDRERASQQNYLMRETYAVPLIVDVWKTTKDRNVARDRAWEIINAIDLDLLENPRIEGVAKELAIEMIPAVRLLPSSTDGWNARSEFNVSVLALSGS